MGHGYLLVLLDETYLYNDSNLRGLCDGIHSRRLVGWLIEPVGRTPCMLKHILQPAPHFKLNLAIATHRLLDSRLLTGIVQVCDNHGGKPGTRYTLLNYKCRCA